MKLAKLTALLLFVALGCSSPPVATTPSPGSPPDHLSARWKTSTTHEVSSLWAVVIDPNTPDEEAFNGIVGLRSLAPALGALSRGYVSLGEWSAMANDPKYSGARRHWTLAQVFDAYVATVSPDEPTTLGSMAKALGQPIWLREEDVTEVNGMAGDGLFEWPVGEGAMVVDLLARFQDGNDHEHQYVCVWLVLGKKVSLSDIYATLKSGSGPAADVLVNQVGLGCDSMIISNGGRSPWGIRQRLMIHVEMEKESMRGDATSPVATAPSPGPPPDHLSAHWKTSTTHEVSNLWAVVIDPNTPDEEAFNGIVGLRSLAPALGAMSKGYVSPGQWSVIANDPKYSSARRHWALAQILDAYIVTVSPDEPMTLGSMAKAFHQPTWLRQEDVTEVNGMAGFGPFGWPEMGSGAMFVSLLSHFQDSNDYEGPNIWAWLVLGKEVSVSDIYATLKSGGGPAADVPVKHVGINRGRWDGMIISNDGTSPWMIRQRLAERRLEELRQPLSRWRSGGTTHDHSE